MRQPDWLGEAWKEFGVAEVKGARHNGRILAMFKDAGHPEIVNDEVAWCAAFLGACVERSGHRGTRSLLARSYLNWGVAIDTPHVGAIAVLSRGADPALGHVGFVVGEADGRLYILGGNQSNRVSVAAFDRSRLLGLRWPQGASASDADTAAEPSDADGPEATAVETEGPQAGDPQFQSALEHVLEMEGGYSDDPHDPGGPTNKGITIGVFARWIGEPINEQSRNRLVSRLKRIPDAMVREIYWTRYWMPAGCGQFARALAFMHFDTAVNHGVGSAIRMLQQAAEVTVDGEIGPETRGAIHAADTIALLVRYAEIRRQRYRSLKHFWRFGRGWLRRVDVTLTRASALQKDPPDAGEDATGNARQQASDSGKGIDTMATNSTPGTGKWWGESLTIWGVIVTTLATVLPAIGPIIGIDISGEMVRQLGQQVAEVVQAIGGIAGTFMAIWGRVRATVPIERRIVSLRL